MAAKSASRNQPGQSGNPKFGLVAAQIPLLRPDERQAVYRFADP